ncbi:hypothetical protein V8G54_037176, partial [Vigna mungo]
MGDMVSAKSASTQKYFAPIILLLQVMFWHDPFHLCGGGPRPLSLKLEEFGQIPVSSIPTIVSLSTFVLWTFSGKPMKFQDLVVWILWILFGITETTSSIPFILSDSSLVS